MRAAILENQMQPFVLRDDIDIAPPQSGQVRVRVQHCGICHSDLSLADGIFPCPTPIILGHEAAGIVDAVGADVSRLRIGDNVVLTPVAACGTCFWCVRGQPGVCVNADSLMTNSFRDGTTGLCRGDTQVFRGVGVGGFGEYVVTPEAGAIRVPASVPLEIACVLGCAVQTGVGAVMNSARIEAGATVLVLGLGGIGLSIVQGARLMGASSILVSDPLATRRDTALRFGATHAIDPTQQDVVGAVMEITGIGVDYAFEAAGKARLIEEGLQATRKGGTTVAVGAPGIDETIQIAPAALFTLTEKRLIGCALGGCNSSRDIPRLIALWQSGRLDLESLITARRPLAEINEAFADLRAGVGIRTILSLRD